MEATSDSAAARTPIDGGADLNSTRTTTKNTTSATDTRSIETKQQLSKDITAMIKKSNLRNNYPTAVASKAISTSDQSQSSLMALPPEIRNNIWENTLKVHAWNKYGVHIVFADFPKERNKKMAPFHQPTDLERRPNSVLSLLRTCRAINTEALPFFYTLNHLWIKGDYVPTSLPTTTSTSRGGPQRGMLGGIGHARVGYITGLTINLISSRDLRYFAEHLAALKRLKTLHVWVINTWLVGERQKFGLDSPVLKVLEAAMARLEILEEVSVRLLKHPRDRGVRPDHEWAQRLAASTPCKAALALV